MKLDEVVWASDVTLNSDELEDQKKTLQAKIKIARRNLTQEINQWDKHIQMYEKKKAKEGMLTNSARSLIKASSDVSQESMLRLLTVVTSSLESLVFMCGNLTANESVILDKWLDELLDEIDSQKDIINDAIETLSNRS